MSSSYACSVSGGIDSMVLLELLFRYQKEKASFSFTVLHFNHHLRGKESDRDENFVRSEAQKRGLPVTVVNARIPQGNGIQEKARNLRRQEMIRLARQEGWKGIFLAHQADDQVETILMNLRRGTGFKGLSGMSPVTFLDDAVRLIRPLLRASREQIALWAKKEGILFVEDSSNATDKYLRNRIRHHWIPQLQKRDPHFQRRFSLLSDSFRKKYEKHEQAAISFLEYPKNRPWIDLDSYFKEPADTRYLILLKIITKDLFNKEFSLINFNEIETLLKRKKPFEKELGKGVFEGGSWGFCYRAKMGGLIPEGWSLKIHGPGEYLIPGLNKKIVIRKGRREDSLCIRNDNSLFPLLLRPALPGDRFHPYGRPGSKKISDFLTNKKVPRFLKKEAMVLCSQDHKIVALLGHEIDHRFRLEDPKAPSLALHFAG